MRFVVDASVAAKWLLKEEGSEEAECLAGCRLLAPELLLIETVNVLWKRVRRGELTETQAGLAYEALTSLGITFLPIAALVRSALTLAIALRHPAYDCCYLALAADVGAPLVTADSRLLRAVAGQTQHRRQVLMLAEAAALVRAER